MRTKSVTPVAVLLLAFAFAPFAAVSAAPGDPEKPAAKRAPTLFKSDRFNLSVRGPAGWTREIEEPVASGRWINLVAFREPKSRARLLVSCQASSYASFDDMRRRLGAHYGNLRDIRIMVGPEVRPAVMGLRSEGLYLCYVKAKGKTSDKAFLAFYLNGRYAVRIYGIAPEKHYQKVEPFFASFLGSLRFHTRGIGSTKPNFVHAPSKCALIFPEGWTVNIPARGAVASFIGEGAGATVYLYRETWSDDLDAYRKRRLNDLERGRISNPIAPEPKTHPKRGEPFLQIDYVIGKDKKVRKVREVCLMNRGAVYRLVVVASVKGFDRGVEALEGMVGSLRFK